VVHVLYAVDLTCFCVCVGTVTVEMTFDLDILYGDSSYLGQVRRPVIDDRRSRSRVKVEDHRRKMFVFG